MNELREFLRDRMWDALAKVAIAQADDLPFLMTRHQGMADAYEQAMAAMDLATARQSSLMREMAQEVLNAISLRTASPKAAKAFRCLEREMLNAICQGATAPSTQKMEGAP